MKKLAQYLGGGQKKNQSKNSVSQGKEMYFLKARDIVQVKNDKLQQYDYQLLLQEFNSLGSGNFGGSVEAAESNSDRNRYVNVIPFDYNRVKLQGESPDYINASILQSKDEELPQWKYIVTQGPLPDTIQQFWLMIVQQKCSTIIMLTRCLENGTEKCGSYFPTDQGDIETIGDITIEVLGEDSMNEDIIMRKLLITQKGEEGFVVRHYQYHRWPDHGVPDTSDPLRSLLKAVEKESSVERPACVHCSAGVGRSGTYIAIDIILRRLKYYEQQQNDSSEHINEITDVNQVVKSLRSQRDGMVQTIDQYYFIYMGILEELTALASPGTSANAQAS